MGTTARNWREYPQRYRLEAAECKNCKKIVFPPRIICPECRSKEFSNKSLSLSGTIKSFTVIRVAPAGFEDLVPYAVGIIEFPEGVCTMMQITDARLESLKVGMKVNIEFRKVRSEGKSGVLLYGYKAVPEE